MKLMIKKCIIVFGMLLIMPCVCFAQSASESYKNGLALMKKAKYTDAIACFKASMAINKSTANVNNCKAQIRKCERLQKQKRNAAPSKPDVEVIPVLKVQTNQTQDNLTLITFPANGDQVDTAKVETVPENANWTFATDANWCKLEKSTDGKELYIACSPSDKTIQRTAKVNIRHESLTHTIDIVQQQGKEVILNTSTTPFVEIGKRKGGAKEVHVICESDTLYENNKNWIIEEAPEWCNIQVEENFITVAVDKLTKKDPEFKMGRTGDIILRSQNKKCIIRVDQK